MEKLRKRLDANGPGVVIAVIALIFALAGTAFAATKLNGKQKKEVEKIAKKFAGATGAQGPVGTTGPQGAAGAKGATGVTGATGNTGTTGNPGLPGAPGKSVEVVAEGPELCEKSPTEKVPGVAYEVEGSGVENTVCDGAEGSPWTAGGTLPPGATETGAWATENGTNEKAPAPLSFTIPLAQKIVAAHIHFKGLAPDPSCPGNTRQPEAAPGFLCIFTGLSSGASEPIVTQLDGQQGGEEEDEDETSFAGAILYWKLSNGFATGSYAVTGCGGSGPLACP